MTNEKAIKHLEVIKGDCALVGDIRALDMAITALTGGEYIKKSELLQHVVTEELSDYQECDVIHAEEIDELTTYSIPDSAEEGSRRIEHGTDGNVYVMSMSNGKEFEEDNTMEWIAEENEEMEVTGYFCSKCDLPSPSGEKTDFCPNCGRKAVKYER